MLKSDFTGAAPTDTVAHTQTGPAAESDISDCLVRDCSYTVNAAGHNFLNSH